MSSSSTLWYSEPAANWDEALPVGNGRIGGMIFGKVGDELIQLNEDSVWSGGFRSRNNPKAYPNLGRMREYLDKGQLKLAEQLSLDAFCGVNENERHYMPAGDLHIYQSVNDSCTDYSRSLELTNAVSTTSYSSNGISFIRTVYVSKPDEVMVINIKSDTPKSISLSACLDGRDDYYDKNCAYDDNTILFTVTDGIPYAIAASCYAKNGKTSVYANRLMVENADEATVILGIQTSWRTADYENLAIRQVKAAGRKGNAKLLKRHIDDYSALYNRCEIILNDNSDGAKEMPTNLRIKRMSEGGRDNKLMEMYYNYSRYLMIAGSREGTLPLNLQGIWNKDMWPAWGCRFTVNINTEMNYWGAEAAALPECCMPLFDHIERMREHGRVTAREMYHCGGAVCHHNTDIWGDTAPQDKWLPGTLWPMGLAWLCLHIMEHYKYTLDKDFLAEKYDTMREAAEFFVDFLIDDGKGNLITSPSVSPENTYRTSNGMEGTICKGPSMDSQIIYELFSAVISASEILGEDKAFADKLADMRDRLPKPSVGKYGQIMEWAEDYDEVEPGHRHISQLFALYPADMITMRETPELAKAARATIERRLANGGGHTGWSRAWIINMWARLWDSEKVYENIEALIGRSTNPNMLDSHPPFQIDGNFGGGAGISEALLQSCGGEIAILPAIPKEWESGVIRKVRARGGFEVSAEWEKGKFLRAKILSEKGGECRIYSKNPFTISCGGKLVNFEYTDSVYIFDTVEGGVYEIMT